MRSLLVVWMVSLATSVSAQTPDFGGWGWGLGLAFTDNLKGSTLVNAEDVSVDELGILRVNRSSNVRARMVFESHHTFQVSSRVAVGPFVAVEPGDDLIQAAGAGIMVELNRPVIDQATGMLVAGDVSFNIGIGVMVEFDASRLADGYVDGQLSPTPNPRLTVREEATLLVMTTVGF